MGTGVILEFKKEEIKVTDVFCEYEELFEKAYEYAHYRYTYLKSISKIEALSEKHLNELLELHRMLNE